MTTPASDRRVLQLASIGPLADARLSEEFDTVRLWEQNDPVRWIGAHGATVGAIATSVRAGCDASLIAKLPSLRAISSWGVGFETIDVNAAHARGIVVANTPGVLDNCVADMAWALLLAASRRIGAADLYVRGHRWQRLGEFPLTTRVWGKRLGILGLGRIGHAVARRAAGFDMEIGYHGRRRRDDVDYRYERSLEDLARWCDFLVVSCVGGPETRHLVDTRVLEALGPRGILVNIARGSVVDQAALVDALQRGMLGGAGLDVLETEPSTPVALCGRDDVVLAPHVGSATVETRAAMEALVVDNLRSFFDSGRLLTPVTP